MFLHIVHMDDDESRYACEFVALLALHIWNHTMDTLDRDDFVNLAKRPQKYCKNLKTIVSWFQRTKHFLELFRPLKFWVNFRLKFWRIFV